MSKGIDLIDSLTAVRDIVRVLELAVQSPEIGKECRGPLFCITALISTRIADCEEMEEALPEPAA
jgi:hypothetical protein